MGLVVNERQGNEDSQFVQVLDLHRSESYWALANFTDRNVSGMGAGGGQYRILQHRQKKHRTATSLRTIKRERKFRVFLRGLLSRSIVVGYITRREKRSGEVK